MTTYNTAKNTYEEGDMEPSEWDKIEEKFLALKNEVNFLKKSLVKLNREISHKRKVVVRLKEETGLYDYKSYREGSY